MSTATTHIKTEKHQVRPEQIRSKLVPVLRFKEFDGEWNEILLDDYAKRGSGHTPSKSHTEYYNGSINWISLTDSKRLDNGFIEQTNTKITQQGIDNSSAVIHPAGTVLLSRDAGVGKSAVMKHEMAVSQHFIVWRTKEGKSSNWFLYNWLQIMKPHFERIAVGNTIKTIGLPYFKKLKIVKPGFPEQQKIASFLSAVDEKIQKLTTKKELLEQYKKGVMQQLFSGQLRFKDENGKPYPDWGEKRLGDICEIKGRIGYRGYTVKDIVKKGEGAITISPSNISDGQLNYDNSTYISWFKYEESPEIKLEVNDILLVKTGSTYGKSAFVKSLDEAATINPQLVILKRTSLVPQYFAFVIYHSTIQKQITATVGAGAVPNLSQESISNFVLPCPPKEEQQKIATYLSNIDTKIEAVNLQITQTQTFKKGLLQQMFVAA